MKIYKLTDILLPHMYTLNKIKCIKLSNKSSEMCPIPHENPATKHFH